MMPQNQMLHEIVDKELNEIANNFKNGDRNLKARYLSRVFGEVIIAVALNKGIEKAFELIKSILKTSKLADLLEGVGIGSGKKIESKEVVSII